MAFVPALSVTHSRSASVSLCPSVVCPTVNPNVSSTTSIPTHVSSISIKCAMRTPSPSQSSVDIDKTAAIDHSSSSSSSDSIWDALSVEKQLLTMTAAMLGFSVFLPPTDALAAIPEGVKEGFKSLPASLFHPAAMWAAVGTTLYTFWLGYQSSRVRQVDPATRKELVKAKYADRHFRLSSTLFAVVSLVTFTGMANTYTRAGKLFPGPHLYAGLGIVALMSVMTSFVPYMQKGKNWARNSHFATAFLVTGLFVWQAQSGMVIVGKLTKWW